MERCNTPFPFALLLSLAGTATVTVLVACGSADSPREALDGLLVDRTMEGDTLVVRTLSGSTWGDTLDLVPELTIGVLAGDEEYLLGSVRGLAVDPEGSIFVLDEQAPALRVYDADGKFRATLGAPGEGPGEYEGPDGGLAVLNDGRIALRDPGNGRIMIYAPDGEESETWRLRGGFRTSRSMYQDQEGNLYASLLVDPEADIDRWVVGLNQIHPDGTPGDTLIPPDPDLDLPVLRAESENSVSQTTVPFSPSTEWTLSRNGDFVWGTTDRYVLHSRTPDGRPLRIERTVEPVPVAPAERAYRERRTTRNMRTTQPNWQWNGPDIPDGKPLWKEIYVSDEGRVWVQRHTKGKEVESVGYDPERDGSESTEWVEPAIFDVFSPDGDYLGAVRAPDGFYPSVDPVLRGNRMWAVVMDEYDVPTVRRFRLDPPSD